MITWKDDDVTLGFKYSELKKKYRQFLRKKAGKAHLYIKKEETKGDNFVKRMYMTSCSNEWFMKTILGMLPKEIWEKNN